MVDRYKYLGVVLGTKLCWKAHLEKTLAKARKRMLALIEERYFSKSHDERVGGVSETDNGIWGRTLGGEGVEGGGKIADGDGEAGIGWTRRPRMKLSKGSWGWGD